MADRDKKRRKRRRVAVRPPVTSMGDIAFLLIIFFMVCSHFIEQQVETTLPRTLDIETIPEAAITVTIDSQNVLYLQGRPVANAEAVKWGVMALLKSRGVDTDEGAPPVADPLQRTVFLKVDRVVDRAVFEPVLRAISEAGAIIAAVGEKGEPQ